MKQRNVRVCWLPASVCVCLCLSLWIASPRVSFAAMPEVIYLGVVDSKEADGHQVTLQTERRYYGNSADCSYVLTGAAPSEEAWAGLEVGDLVEARCFGGPGDAPGRWLLLARLHSRSTPCITVAYGDVAYTHSAWMGGFQVRYNNVPDCENCEADTPLCPTLFSEVSIDSETYEVPLGSTVRHDDGRYEVEVTFRSGDTRPWPECAPWDGWAGPQLVSNFTIRVRSTGPVSFRRGDVDADNDVNLTDGVYILNHLFLGGSPPFCLDSADTDDNGGLDTSDAVLLFGYLFLGKEPPAAPFLDCGEDTTEDELTCSEYSPCE